MLTMTPTEEAALRTAIAERERRLAAALTNQQPGLCPDIRAMREGIERLRQELVRGGKC